MSNTALFVIDILDDPDHHFQDVFGNFLKHEQLDLSLRYLNGFDENIDYAAALAQQPAGIVISGSLQSVYERQDWMLRLEEAIRQAHHAEIPIFGICFGHQILASALGGEVTTLNSWEFGAHPIYINGEHPYLKGFKSGDLTLQVHQDHVSTLPPGAQSLALTEKTPHQIFALNNSFGVQFHPEYTVDMLHTIIRNRHEKFVQKGPFTSETHLQNMSQHWQISSPARQILKNFLVQFV